MIYIVWYAIHIPIIHALTIICEYVVPLKENDNNKKKNLLNNSI